MSDTTELAHWRKDALALDATRVRLAMPVHVLTGEAVDVARFFATYWATRKDPHRNIVLRPGLDSVSGAKHKLLPANTGEKILSLGVALQQAQTAYLLAVDPAHPVDLVARGHFVLSEIVAALEYRLGHDAANASDAGLTNVEREHHDDPGTADALASELDDFAGLADEHRADLEELESFDGGLIAEARSIAAALRERSPTAGRPTNAAAHDALDLRNRVATLLSDAMTKVRAAGRFAFRHHPEIVREATSAYERQKRALSRRKKRAATGATGATGTGAAGRTGAAAGDPPTTT